MLGLDPKSSLISAYQSGRSNPSYEICSKLLLCGMSPKELFGELVSDKIKSFYMEHLSPKNSDTPKDLVIKGLKAIILDLEKNK